MTNHSEASTTSVRVPIRGEIDVDRVGDMDAAIDAALAENPATVILDLAELDFMDSTGLASLLTARQRLADIGGLLVLRRPPRTLCTLLDVTGLAPLFEIEP